MLKAEALHVEDYVAAEEAKLAFDELLGATLAAPAAPSVPASPTSPCGGAA